VDDGIWAVWRRVSSRLRSMGGTYRGWVGPGAIPIDRLGGRTSFPTYAQAAEIDVRRALGLDGVDALRLERARRDGDLAHVLFATPSGRVAVTERRVEGPPMRLTCGHDHEEAPVAWRLEGLDAAG
jgi:hypothetical protein